MRIGARVLVLLAALCLSASCNRRPPTPPRVAPPPAFVAAMDSAARDFAAGDYASAARNFQRYLELAPEEGEHDRALYHLGLIFAGPGAPSPDWEMAEGYLSRLVTEFPDSSWRPTAQLILSLRSETLDLAAQVRRQTAQSQQQSTESQRRAAENQRLAAEVQRLEDRVRQLTTELERLIKIDSGRRP